MPIVTVTPGDQQDGCGPYGRHLTGAVDWQKYYPFLAGPAAYTILVADKDYLITVPPPSETLATDQLRTYVSTGGTTSFVRYALYDASAWPTLSLIVDAGEVASDAVALTSIVIASQNLSRSGRYAAIVCARGAVLPTLQWSVAGYGGRTWLGSVSLQFVVGMRFARANGAFPATYNGVYEAVLTAAPQMDARLP
jgi:hypothetical protein